MKNFFKNYKSTIILLVAIIVGSILGIIFQEKATILSPLGDLFLNLLLVIIVPLIFLSITTSISKMETPKRLGKILITIIAVFIVVSLIAVLVGFFTTYPIKLVEPANSELLLSSLDTNFTQDEESISFLSKTVQLISVNDFSKLLSKDNIIALLVFSIIFGIAINMSKEKAKPVIDFLNSANDVLKNIIKIIMYYAPIGICCYIASFIGSFGASLAIGYVKTFIIYLIVSILFFVIVYTAYAFIAGGKKGVKLFWLNVWPAFFTSIATCSSAASIAVNIECSKKIGVSSDIAEATIPLGTSFHKDGSIIGSVFKIMFLVSLFGTTLATTPSIFAILGVSLIATLLIAAVPIGGGTISEMLIITMLGFPVAVLPLLTVVATIIDAPATMLNVCGDTVSSMLVSRIVDGKNWINQ